MARMPVLSARDILRALQRVGFERVGQKGSHIRLKGVRAGRKRIVIVPNHDEVTPGTLKSILRQSGLTRDEWRRLLR